MAHQYLTLAQIAEQFRQGLLSATRFKQFVSAVRCAEHSDNNLFKEERASIERAWPAFAADTSLSRPPGWVYNDVQLRFIFAQDDAIAEGKVWKAQYEKRLQRTLSRMNHHIYPLCSREDNVETGDRRPLSSCTTTAKPKVCRSDFPLHNEMTEVHNSR